MKKETFKEIIETDHSILLLDIREPGVVERELCERGYLIDGLEGGLEALRET